MLSSREAGEQIMLARRRARKTQKDISESTGLSRSHIAAIESGRASMKFSDLNVIASALRIDPSSFIQGVRLNEAIAPGHASGVLAEAAPGRVLTEKAAEVIAYNINHAHSLPENDARFMFRELLMCIAEKLEQFQTSHEQT